MNTSINKKNHQVFQCVNNRPDLCAVIMASGYGKRFGGNKLFSQINGMPMIENIFQTMPKDLFSKICVVSIYQEVLSLAQFYDLIPVFNSDKTDDISQTIKLGLQNIDINCLGCMFFVGDQPWLKSETIAYLVSSFLENPQQICLPSFDGQRGNPVIFPKSLYNELASLKPNQQGKTVIKNHEDLIREIRIKDPKELKDVDRPSDILGVNGDSSELLTKFFF